MFRLGFPKLSKKHPMLVVFLTPLYKNFWEGIVFPEG
jgi:hypothetical protein